MTETKTTPIAELTPEQFNARFPVGTRVAIPGGESTIVDHATWGVCNVLVPVGSGLLFLHESNPIVTLGSLNVGDEFRWHDETPGAGVYRVEEMAPNGGAIMALGTNMRLPFSAKSRDVLVQVVALNHAHDDRPEVFPGSMLREGDVVEFAPSRGCSADDAERWNRDLAPLTFDGSTLRGREAVQRVDSFRTWTFRLVAATVPAPVPTEPCPAPVEVEQAKPEQKCDRCGVPESKYTALYVDEGITTLCGECFPDSRQQPNGTFLPPKPPRRLPPSVAYHLDDDADASGLPGHN